MARRPRALSTETRVLLLALAGGAPAMGAMFALLWMAEASAKVHWTLGLVCAVAWLGFAAAVRERFVRPLQTLSNLLGAIREGDYSVRGRTPRMDDALGEVMTEVNSLSDRLRERRFSELEASALLEQVIDEIDVAIFAFDEEHRLKLVNRAGRTLLGPLSALATGKNAEELGLAVCLEGAAPRTLPAGFLGGGGPYELRRREFRQEGRPHRLLVLTDVSRAMREEERTAWQRLLRVLGHEINNSLAPIQSIATSLSDLIAMTPRPEGWEEDVASGMKVVGRRAESLSRFMTSYSRLTRLPPPRLGPVEVPALAERVARLETRRKVEVRSGPEVTIQADADQLEQLLINLVRNAVDAAHETDGAVNVYWRVDQRAVELCVEDEGPGLPETANLFVPFFTTKKGGSGIGLALSRQIAEGHGGKLTLENRTDRKGVRARLVLPTVSAAP